MIRRLSLTVSSNINVYYKSRFAFSFSFDLIGSTGSLTQKYNLVERPSSQVTHSRLHRGTDINKKFFLNV